MHKLRANYELGCKLRKNYLKLVQCSNVHAMLCFIPFCALLDSQVGSLEHERDIHKPYK
jgi:hypothetical protein